MAKKKTAKKPAKTKPAKAAKLAKKSAKAAPKPVAKAAKGTATKAAGKKSVKATSPAKKPTAAKANKAPPKGKQTISEPTAPVKVAKGKKNKAAAGVVEVVIAPSNPLLKGLRKEGAASKTAAAASVPAAKKRCRDANCDHDGIMSGYCRLHYIKNWRRIKRKEAILASGQLNNYVEELVKKYPDKYLDVIRQDLASEKEWAKVVVDLELESSDDDAGGDEDIDPAAEGVRHDRDFDEEDGNF